MTDLSPPPPGRPDEMAATPLWTVPNVICALRLVGLAPLLWLAWNGRQDAFLVLLLVLLLSDWLDGKLAKILDQTTTFGARLDSFADACLYSATGLGVWWLEPAAVRDLLPWLVAVAATWWLSAGVSLVRFRRLPSYHTWGAKISWLLVGLGLFVLLRGGGTGVARWALAAVVLTNLEAATIGLLLPRWKVDVRSLFHALRLRRDDPAPSQGDEP